MGGARNAGSGRAHMSMAMIDGRKQQGNETLSYSHMPWTAHASTWSLSWTTPEPCSAETRLGGPKWQGTEARRTSAVPLTRWHAAAHTAAGGLVFTLPATTRHSTTRSAAFVTPPAPVDIQRGGRPRVRTGWRRTKPPRPLPAEVGRQAHPPAPAPVPRCPANPSYSGPGRGTAGPC